MGYTHYWCRKKEFPKRAFLAAVEDCRKVCDMLRYEHDIPLANADGDKDSEPEFTSDCVHFNGVGDEGYEDFYMPRSYGPPSWQKPEAGRYFAFCKTVRKPYDLAVQCCLLVFQQHLGKHMTISSDGTEEEWLPAVELCNKLLGYGVFVKEKQEA